MKPETIVFAFENDTLKGYFYYNMLLIFDQKYMS